MSTTLRFQGKIAFQGTNPGQQFYLTRYRGSNHQFLPAMTASSLTDSEKCILYQVQSNPLIVVIQLASLEYLTLDTTLGWIELSSDLTNAAHFEITSTANQQQSWQVVDGQQLSPVCYTVYNPANPPPLLTINESPPDTFTTFTAQIITDDLDTILANKVANKNGRGIDFINVDLSGQDVSGVDFTGANFTGANLTGTIFRGAILTQAIFIGATLDGTIFDGAILDQANFSGANTVLKTVNWGQPKSAQNINFSGCDGRGTQLMGKPGNLIPCNSANFTNNTNNNANFSGATLSYLTLDDADLTGTIAAGTDFTGTSLQRVKANGANFCGATLNHANLSNGQFGAKALLFALTQNVANYITELNHNDVVPPDIAAACKNQPNGIDISNGTVKVLASGQSWLITTGTAVYNMRLSADGAQLLVYLYGGATAATFAGASLFNSTSTGANFASVDLSNCLWLMATADHIDLESTNLSGSFLLQTNFTQAQLFGTTLSNAVLIQAKFIGATLVPNVNNIAPSFTNAQLQGTDFTNANVINGNLYQAAIALPNGVPLFVISSSYISDLNMGNLAAVATVFTNKGYPLGTGASLSSISSWLIDNSANTAPPCIKTFAIDQNLNVYDASNLNTILFTLPSTYQSFLNQPQPARPLILYFQNESYPLSAQAAISINTTTWQISNSPDALVNLPVVYETIAIVSESDGFLHVYGSTTLWLKNVPAYSSDIAFGTTQAIQTAINSQTICPNGQPKNEFDTGSYTWEQMMTCPTP